MSHGSNEKSRYLRNSGVTMEKKKEDDASLVTGNTKHFPKVSFVVTPREMFDIVHGIVSAPEEIEEV